MSSNEINVKCALNSPFRLSRGFFSLTPLKIKGARDVMNFWIKQIKAAESNSLNPSYVRGITLEFKSGD